MRRRLELNLLPRLHTAEKLMVIQTCSLLLISSTRNVLVQDNDYSRAVETLRYNVNATANSEQMHFRLLFNGITHVNEQRRFRMHSEVIPYQLHLRPWCFFTLLSQTRLSCLTLSSMLFTNRPNFSNCWSLKTITIQTNIRATSCDTRQLNVLIDKILFLVFRLSRLQIN